MGRIEEFTCDGESFIYFDFSGFKINYEFKRLTTEGKAIIEKYPKQSVYTITNIKGILFDTQTKEIFAQWAEHNKPYVKQGAMIGMDGIKKIMMGSVLEISGRENVGYAHTKEQAIKLLLSSE